MSKTEDKIERLEGLIHTLQGNREAAIKDQARGYYFDAEYFDGEEARLRSEIEKLREETSA